MLGDVLVGFFISDDSGSILLAEMFLCKCRTLLIFLVNCRVLSTLLHHLDELMHTQKYLLKCGKLV